MEKPIDIIASGHLCLDLLPQMDHLALEALASPGRLYEIGSMGISTGGAASNTGLALHRLGVNVRLMSSVGDDSIGRLILEFLQRRDPAITEYIRVITGQKSSYTLVFSPQQTDRMFLQFAGTNATFCSDDIDFQVVSRAKIFHLGYPPLLPALIADNGVELAHLFSRAGQAGAITSLDMSLPDPGGAAGHVDWRELLKRALPYVDIFIPSLEEILFMLRREDFNNWNSPVAHHVSEAYLAALVDDLLDMGAGIGGVKLGEYGIYIRTASKDKLSHLGRRLPIKLDEWADRQFWHPAFAVKVVGTTGAGDSAYAGFLTALLKGLSVENAARWACAVGACNVEAVDSTSGVQSWDDTQRRLNSGWDVLSLHLPQS